VINVPRMYHPFRHLRDLGPTVTMSVGPTVGNKEAWWCPESDHFTLRPDLNQVQRRCGLAHELAHRDLGHEGQGDHPEGRRRTELQERAADELAARRLIRLSALVDVLVWTDDPDEAADGLWVTRRLLDVRLETMLGGERRWVAVELRRRRAE
jgi:hypothetical protein